MSDAQKTELAMVVSELKSLKDERKTHLDAYNAASAKSKTLRVRRAELEVEVAKAKAAAKVTETPAAS